MSFGGSDRVLPFRWQATDRDLVLRFARHVWPEGVYEDALGMYAGTLSEALRFAPPSAEFFIYVTQEARVGWDADGATPDTESSMLHVIGGEGEVTLVFDRPGSVLAGVVEELSTVIARNRFPGREVPRTAA